MKKINLKNYHWDFIVSYSFFIYVFCDGVFFLYRKSIYYNYIFLFLLGTFLGMKLGRKLFEKKEK
jgi:uncharacterized membrane protein YfcA